MKGKLKHELVKLSTDIITSRDLNEITDLYEVAKNLYEKLAVLKFIEEKLNDIEVDVSKSVMAAKFESMANAVLNENSSVPESNPHDEDIMIPGMDTIKDMVSEMSGIDKNDLLDNFLEESGLMKNEKEILMPDSTSVSNKVAPKSLNDRLNNGFKIGLNDKLAFVKHLFNTNTDDYNRVISQLNTIETEERSIAFINNMVKPEYNDWQGKEEYEERFLDLISRKFS